MMIRVPAIVVGIFCIIVSCHAAIINVPGDQLTIQGGIDTAVAGDTVLVADGTYTGDGNRNIDFNGKAITVMSENGAESCVIDCEGSTGNYHRGIIFQNDENEYSTIQGFTIKNGYNEYYGAGIYCYYASPTIRNCTITENSADYGGGVACDHASPTISDCIFSDNTAEIFDGWVSLGGGVFCTSSSSPVITNCTITGNMAGRGAGICLLASSSAKIANCTITGNTGFQGGGGVYCHYSSPTISNCVIADNSAGGGGGIGCEGSSPTITNCTITGNSARDGGGIFTSDGSPIIGGDPGSGNYFAGNKAFNGSDLAGGDQSSPVNATYNYFAGYCFSDYYVSPNLSFDLSNCTSELLPIRQDIYVSPTGNDSNEGLTPETSFRTMQHAMHMVYGTETDPVTIHLASGTYSPSITGESFPVPLINNVSIAGMGETSTILDAESSSCVFFGRHDDNISISALTITGGSYYTGGGLHFWSSSLTITHCTIAGNYAGHGGAGLGFYNSSPTITDCSFKENAGHQDGGAIFSKESSSTITNCSFSGNASKYGGGIYCFHSSPTISNCEFTGNSVERYGGGIYFEGDCSPLIAGCTFQFNFADDGGGIHHRSYSSTSSPNLTDCAIIGNSGGGICFYNDSFPIITNCSISGNIGSGIYCWISSPTITSCTFTENSTGLYCWDSSPALSNCILWNNAQYEILASESTSIVTFSCIQGGYEGEGNIDEDPLFVSGPLGAYYLSQIPAGQTSDSPCVNTGSDLAGNICFETPESVVCLDEYWTRTDGIHDSGQVDMGAHYPLPGQLWPNVEIMIPSAHYSVDDIFSCDVIVTNYGNTDLQGYPLFVLLGIGDQFFFAPGFSDFEYYTRSFPAGETTIGVVPEFLWPSGAGSGSGCWYAAMTNQDIQTLYGNLSVFDFSWSEQN